MFWMILLGVIALLIGGLLIVSPKSLLRMNEELNRMVTRIDEQVLKYRIGFGVSLILAAIFLFFYAFMLGRGR
jgi:predicted membrane-bound mannosyltransferase